MMRRRNEKKTFVVSEVRTREDAPVRCGFRVRWRINPHMKIGSSCLEIAEAEHDLFVRTLERAGADVIRLPYLAGAYDSVFMKDSVLLRSTPAGTRAMLARPFADERRGEPERRAAGLERAGMRVIARASEPLEGGDVVVAPGAGAAFMGHGFRTSRAARAPLERFLGVEVVPLELVDPYFYHLDTAMNVTAAANGERVVFACPHAFDRKSWRRLRDHPAIDRLIPVDRGEAMRFATNWVEVGGVAILGAPAPRTREALEHCGKKVVVSPLSQFLLAGGSAACLVAPVYGEACPRRAGIGFPAREVVGTA